MININDKKIEKKPTKSAIIIYLVFTLLIIVSMKLSLKFDLSIGVLFFFIGFLLSLFGMYVFFPKKSRLQNSMKWNILIILNFLLSIFSFFYLAISVSSS
ncbi:MAG: hypothetical protein WC894_06080 [Patescibacteria group bacterium]